MLATRMRYVASTLAPTIALLLVLTVPLHAHDIYSSWVEAKVLPGKLEIKLTLARSSAPRLLGDERSLPSITPENFAEYEPKLREIARELIHVNVAGKRVPASAAEVAIGGDSDITFTIVHLRLPPGKLAFLADYLRYLVDGHVATIVATNAAGDDLGWSPVTIDQPVFEVTPPAPKKSKS